MKPKFNIGDTVWVAWAGNEEVSITCPDCFGKRYLTVILGDDSQVTIDCSCCGGKTYEGPVGRIKTVKFVAKACELIINNISVVNNCVQYNYKDERDVFETEKEALVRAEEFRVKCEKADKNRLEYLKEDANRTWAWNVSYHRRELKEAIRKVEYHTKKLSIAKERAKEKDVLVYES